MKRKSFGWLLLAALMPAPGPGRAHAAQRRSHFSDVPPNHWAYDAVNELADLGILVGYPATPKAERAPVSPRPERSAIQQRPKPGGSPRPAPRARGLQRG